MAILEKENAPGATFMGIRWDNHISIGHIFTTISMIVVASMWYANTENRLSNLERQDVLTMQIIDRNRQDRKEEFKEIRSLLKEISDKVSDLNARKEDRVTRQ